MSDLIDREQALSLPMANGKYDHENADEHFINGLETYREWLEGLPVVEIIHCKDCKYSNDKEFPATSSGYTRCIRPTFSFWMPEDGFCSYGERRKEE